MSIPCFRRELPSVLLVLLALGGCEKFSLDRQMEVLCQRDGGIRVYEKVQLPSDRFDDFGYPILGKKSRSMEERLGSAYQLVTDDKYLKGGDPMKGEGQLLRMQVQIVRVADAKVLGEGVVYGRSGGDFIVVDHFSSKGCPAGLGLPGGLVRSVFVREGE